MKCTVCGNEFDAKRADAKFCSSTCRSKASRGITSDMVSGVTEQMVDDSAVVLDAESVAKIMAGTVPELNITPDGQVRQVWDKNNPIPNLEGGYFHIGQTQQEYIDNLPARGYLKNGEKCEHPATESFYSRCLLCNEMLRYVRVGDSFMKASDKKKKNDENKI